MDLMKGGAVAVVTAAKVATRSAGDGGAKAVAAAARAVARGSIIKIIQVARFRASRVVWRTRVIENVECYALLAPAFTSRWSEQATKLGHLAGKTRG